jgi:hypothetical protein
MATNPNTPARPRPATAPTNLAELLPDIDAGLLEMALSSALSQTASAVVDFGTNGPKVRTGSAGIKFEFEHIKGTHQVIVNYTVTFKKPQPSGSASEEVEGQVVLYVGKGGALSIAQGALRISAAQGGLALGQPGTAPG